MQLRMMLQRGSPNFKSQLARPEIATPLKLALEGSVLTYSLLDHELGKFGLNNLDDIGQINLGRRARARVVWNDGLMNDILQRLSEIQTSLSMLFQILQL
jgi:hypothetical protein